MLHRIIKLLFIYGILFFILSCSITYKVRNTTGEISEKTTMPFGDIYVSLTGKGKRIFKLDMLCSPDPGLSMVVFRDSLHVFFNDSMIEHTSSGTNVFRNEGRLSLKFRIEEGVFDGDTILISGTNAVKCKERTVSLGPYIYVLKNNFRLVSY